MLTDSFVRSVRQYLHATRRAAWRVPYDSSELRRRALEIVRAGEPPFALSTAFVLDPALFESLVVHLDYDLQTRFGIAEESMREAIASAIVLPTVDAPAGYESVVSSFATALAHQAQQISRGRHVFAIQRYCDRLGLATTSSGRTTPTEIGERFLALTESQADVFLLAAEFTLSEGLDDILLGPHQLSRLPEPYEQGPGQDEFPVNKIHRLAWMGILEYAERVDHWGQTPKAVLLLAQLEDSGPGSIRHTVARLYADHMRRGVEIMQGSVFAESYRLDARLGGGQYGEVWRATHLASGAAVALKRYPGLDERVRKSLRNEARCLAALHGKRGFPSLVGFSVAAGTEFLAMQLIDGATLRDWLTRDPSEDERLRVIEEAADALHRARASVELSHRDLKLDNLMVDEHGTCVVVDFGVAKSPLLAGQTATSGGHPGNIRNTPPEVLTAVSQRGEPVDFGEPQDVWSLGCVLHEVLSGRHPFEVEGDLLTTQARIAGANADLETTSLPAGVSDLLQAMFDRDPEQRPPLAAVRDEIAACRTRE